MRLQELGYTGGISILKEFVHPLRPAVGGHAPVKRYETKPGEQLPTEWPVDGSTGYDFAALMTGLMVDGAGVELKDTEHLLEAWIPHRSVSSRSTAGPEIV